MGLCCAKEEPELSDAVAPKQSASFPAPAPAPAPKPKKKAPPEPEPEPDGPTPLTSWSAEEVGEWLEATVGLVRSPLLLCRQSGRAAGRDAAAGLRAAC